MRAVASDANRAQLGRFAGEKFAAHTEGPLDHSLTAPWGAVAPGMVIVVIVLGANSLADGLRERFDPTRRERR